MMVKIQVEVFWVVMPCNIVVKAKLSLCLTKHHAIRTYWGSGGIAPRVLDLITRWN